VSSKQKKSSPSPESARPTVKPPGASEELASKPEARRTPGNMKAVRDAQVTITNEVELEAARLKSMESLDSMPSPSAVMPKGEPAIFDKADPEAEMNERFTIGDFAGALRVAEELLASDPKREDATRIARESKSHLLTQYEARLGSLDRVPAVVMGVSGLRDLAIDHRAGFLLSHIDGVSSLETILDVSGMPRLDAVKILVELVQKRVVALR
jgi:hypothetical protein